MRLCDHFELDMIAGSAQHPAVTLARTEGRTREDCPMCKLGHLPTDRFAVCTSSLQLHTIQAIHALVIGIPGNLQRVDSPVPINLPPQSFATSSEATLGVSSCAKPSCYSALLFHRMLSHRGNPMVISMRSLRATPRPYRATGHGNFDVILGPITRAFSPALYRPCTRSAAALCLVPRACWVLTAACDPMVCPTPGCL